jgi:hypothetical protein
MFESRALTVEGVGCRGSRHGPGAVAAVKEGNLLSGEQVEDGRPKAIEVSRRGIGGEGQGVDRQCLSEGLWRKERGQRPKGVAALRRSHKKVAKIAPTMR